MTELTDATAGDEVLRWASEVGSGSWDRLRDICAYVAQKHGIRRRPWSIASDLSALGHLDIDWTSRNWSIAPPALNLVPGLGLCVVLTGSRPHYLDRRFDVAADDMNVFPFDISQPPSPCARFAKCASVEDAQLVAERLTANLVFDPANGLALAMRAVNETVIKPAPEPSLEEALRFNPVTLSWVPDHGRKPGLYRIDLHGRSVHRRLDEYGLWSAIELASGQFLVLREQNPDGEPVLRWLPATADRPPCFEVRAPLALPVLAERALVISCGLVPAVLNGWRRYLNVPVALADSIAGALLQPLLTFWGE